MLKQNQNYEFLKEDEVKQVIRERIAKYGPAAATKKELLVDLLDADLLIYERGDLLEIASSTKDELQKLNFTNKQITQILILQELNKECVL